MTQGVAAFEDAEFRPADVLQFQQDQNLTVTKMSVLGPNSGGYFGEASLDTQYIFATGNAVPGWFISQEEFDLLSWSFKVRLLLSPALFPCPPALASRKRPVLRHGSQLATRPPPTTT